MLQDWTHPRVFQCFGVFFPFSIMSQISLSENWDSGSLFLVVYKRVKYLNKQLQKHQHALESLIWGQIADSSLFREHIIFLHGFSMCWLCRAQSCFPRPNVCLPARAPPSPSSMPACELVFGEVWYRAARVAQIQHTLLMGLKQTSDRTRPQISDKWKYMKEFERERDLGEDVSQGGLEVDCYFPWCSWVYLCLGWCHPRLNWRFLLCERALRQKPAWVSRRSIEWTPAKRWQLYTALGYSNAMTHSTVLSILILLSQSDLNKQTFLTELGISSFTVNELNPILCRSRCRQMLSYFKCWGSRLSIQEDLNSLACAGREQGRSPG